MYIYISRQRLLQLVIDELENTQTHIVHIHRHAWLSIRIDIQEYFVLVAQAKTLVTLDERLWLSMCKQQVAARDTGVYIFSRMRETMIKYRNMGDAAAAADSMMQAEMADKSRQEGADQPITTFPCSGSRWKNSTAGK